MSTTPPRHSFDQAPVRRSFERSRSSFDGPRPSVAGRPRRSLELAAHRKQSNQLFEDVVVVEAEISRQSIELVQAEREAIQAEFAGASAPVKEPVKEPVVDTTPVASEQPRSEHKMPGDDEPLPEHDLVKGYDDEQVAKQREIFGFNEILEKKTPLWKQILQYFYSPMSILMELAAILAGIVQSWPDFGIILGLLFVNLIVQFGEEYQAGNAVAALREQLALRARVLRKGEWTQIDSRELVPGDVIRVKVGDVVPADGRLAVGDGVIVDQAALTGESLPVDKFDGDTILSSSTIKHGDMKAVVTKIGSQTFFGRAATLVNQKRKPGRIEMLVNSIARFLIVLTLLLVVVVIAVGATNPVPAGMTVKDHAFEVLEFATLVTISGIPLGLNAVLSVTMAVGVRVMARNKVIVSRMTAIEDLAGTDILCSDKTGTLTKNELTLGTPIIYNPFKLEDIHLYAGLSSELHDGDVIDTAIGKWMPSQDVLIGHETIKFIPFDAVIKRTEAVVRMSDQRVIRVSKGAVHKIEALIIKGTALPEVKQLVTQMQKDNEEAATHGIRCLAIAVAEHETDWTPVGMLTLFDPPRDDAAHTIKELNDYGVGVKMITGDTVAIGRETARRLGMKDDILNADALAGIEVMDRVKLSNDEDSNIFVKIWRKLRAACGKPDPTDTPAAPATPAVAGAAPGVGTEMVQVSVDSAIPAATTRPKSALHEAMALHESEKAGPKDPVDVEKLTDLVELSSGFAQMLPEHKYIVVDLLQARGHIVAMTGDGVNDAPALKRADVGVAVSGATDAARMAASLVLQEPGLNVIVEAIRESRRIFARMESYVLYRINATLELLFFLVLSACILDFKLSGIQIVFLVLVNDITVMLIAIDHVAVQPLPQHWNLKYLTSIASFIGAFSVAIVMTTLVVMMNYYGVPATQMTSLMFLQLSITDQLTILSTRTRGIFFVSMPHWMLLSACILTQILFTLFVLFGVAMPAADGNLVGIIWGISMGSLIVKDLAKVCMTFLMDRILGIKHGVWFEPSCEGISCIKCSKE